VSSLAEISETQDGVRLTLTVDLVTWKDNSGLTLGATVKNINDHAIQYDPGGCGCPNPGPPFIESEGGERCVRYPRPLCPCSWGSVVELASGGEIGGWGEVALNCLDGPSEAVAGFFYELDVNGEPVHRYLEVRWPVSLPSPSNE
jgi:hypothetical protein